MLINRLRLSLLLLVCTTSLAQADFTVDFNDRTVAANAYDDGGPTSNGGVGTNIPAGGFTSNGLFFNNVYSPSFGGFFSNGFALSTVNNTGNNNSGNADYTYLYDAITGTAPSGSGPYAIASAYSPGDAYINLPTGDAIKSFEITNTTYGYLSMTNGDSIAGGPFTTGDYLRVKVTGFSSQGGANGTGSALGSIVINLASPTGVALKTWNTIDLSSLAMSQSLSFSMMGSRNNSSGLLSPAFFALDNVVVGTSQAVPEPSSLVLIAAGLAGLAIVKVRKKRATA